MSLGPLEKKLVVVVGAGGVGKTTLAAALGLCSAGEGTDTLVMTFDPSLRLKDVLGVGESAKDRPVRVKSDTTGRLDVILLDARSTFDRLIRRYAPDQAAAQRIYSNRFYRELAGNLAGILEYMAVERLFEVASEGRYGRIILDTPPTRQALDFLEAPDRIISFLDSGFIRLALGSETGGRLKRVTSKIAMKGAEGLADKLIGPKLLGEMLEFFRAFAPLYTGFRERAEEVRALLRGEQTVFALVSGPGADRIPDTMFFARKLGETGHRVGCVVVNQTVQTAETVHEVKTDRRTGGQTDTEGLRLIWYLGQRDREGIVAIRRLLKEIPLGVVPLTPAPPNTLAQVEDLGRRMLADLA